MTTSRRILVFSAVGIVIYLLLSLYHDHQLRKLPGLAGGGGQRFAREQEKNWVQVSTSDESPGKPARNQEVAEERSRPAEPGSSGQPPGGAQVSRQGDGTAMDFAARQSELQQAGRLREALERERAAKLQAEEALRRLRAELNPVGGKQAAALTDLDRLRAELRAARTRAAIVEEELARAKLKAEAMFQYGQEQNRQLAPVRQENADLKARLQENDGRLRQAETRISELTAREQDLQRELQRARPEDATRAPAPGDSAGR